MRCNKLSYSFRWPYDENGRCTYGRADAIGPIRVNYRNEPVNTRTSLFLREDRAFLGLLCNLEGELLYGTHNLEQPLGTLKRKQYNLLYLPEGVYEFSQNKKKHALFTIDFTPEFLSVWAEHFTVLTPFLEIVRLKIPYGIGEPMILTTEMEGMIKNLLSFKFTGLPMEHFFFAKTVSIIDYSFKQMAYVSRTDKLRRAIILEDKLHRAKECLINQVSHPWSLDLLSEKIQLKKSRLSRGFKKLFGKAVMEFLLEERMKKSIALLRESDMPVKQIAVTVGYKETGFSHAFKKYFGNAPSYFRRKAAG